MSDVYKWYQKQQLLHWDRANMREPRKRWGLTALTQAEGALFYETGCGLKPPKKSKGYFYKNFKRARKSACALGRFIDAVVGR